MKSGLRLVGCAILVAGLALVWCGEVRAVIVTRNFGPVDITFYGENDVTPDGDVGAADWTKQQIDDVDAMMRVYTTAIKNPVGLRDAKVSMLWSSLSPGVLGSSANPLTGDGTNAGSRMEAVWRDRQNVSAVGSDFTLQFSTDFLFHLGATEPDPMTDETDFRSVVAHELGHTLGFFDSYDPAGQMWGVYRGLVVGLTRWDKGLRDAPVGGNQPAAGLAGQPAPFNATAAPVYWDGVRAKALNGGNRVAAYAPEQYSSGSSLAHLDPSVFPDALMGPFIGSGEMRRQLTPLEWGMMQDMGWTVNYSIVTDTWDRGARSLNWEDADNWGLPGTADVMHNALFSKGGLLTGDLIQLGGNRSVYSLTFSSVVDFSIGGDGRLRLVSGKITRTADATGNQTIDVPIELAANGIFDISGDGQLIVSGDIGGVGKSLEKRGSGALVLAGNNTFSGDMRVRAGTVEVAGGQTWGDIAAVNIANGAVLRYSLTGASAVTLGSNNSVSVDPQGTLILDGPQSALADGGRYVMVVNEGPSFLVNGTHQAVGAIQGVGITTVGPGADLTATGIRQQQLSIGAGGRATIRATATPNTAASTSRLSALMIAGGTVPTGTLDLNNNSLVLDYAGSVGTTLSDVTAQIRSGRNGKDRNDQANWDGTGIITTAGWTANHSAHVDRYNIGAVNNADFDAAGIRHPLTAFGGQAVTPNTVLVKYTYSGDADLSGVVDGDDYSYWLNGFLNTTNPAVQGWLRGDFDYNGVVDGDDYTQWLNSFLFGGPPVSSPDGPAPVPEPATVVMLAVGVVCLGRRLLRRPAEFCR